MSNKKTIFLTGSYGFAGKHLQNYLKDKYILFAPSHKKLDLLNDKAVDKFFNAHKIDVVIHTALVGGSRSEESKENALDSNLRMFFNIVRNKNKFKKLIHCGSGAEYDKRFPIVKVKEEEFDKRVPIDEYGFSKYICSKYIESSESVVCLRIFALFGEGERYMYRFISNAICRNLLGLPITMRQDVYFDYFNVGDFVKIVDYFIENKAKYKFYNVGSGNRINIKTIAKMINQVSDKKSDIIIGKKGLNNEYTCNNNRLMSELQDFNFIKMEDSIKMLYSWYKENIDKIDKKLL